MFRFVFAAFGLAGILAAVQPAFTDPRAVATFQYAQIAAFVKQPTPQVSAASSPSPVAPPGSGLGKDIAPVGFGWG
jgi:hypothetical protein